MLGLAFLIIGLGLTVGIIYLAYFFTSQPGQLAALNSCHAIKQIFDNEGAVVSKVRPLKSFGNINGYVLLLDQDGYSLLNQFSEK